MQRHNVLIAVALMLCTGLTHAIDLDQSPARPASIDQVVDVQLEEALADQDWRAGARDRGFRVRGDLLQLCIDSAEVGWLSAWLESHGAQHVLAVGDRVQAWVPRRILDQLSELEAVRWVSRPDYAISGPGGPEETEAVKAGTVTSQGVRASNAVAWHAAGFTGTGIKVGIIDGGFEDFESLLGSDLPPAGQVHFETFGGTDNEGSGNHGTGCAEVVHDMAPDAELYFALVSSNLDVVGAMDWLSSNNVDVITMSLGFFNVSPGDGSGTLQELIDDTTLQDDLVFATSAGNVREGHWQGQTDDADGDGWIEFADDEEVNLYSGTLGVGERISAKLVWNDWDAPDQDYSLHLFRINDDGSSTEVSSSDRPQSGYSFQRPTEDLSYVVPTAGRYGISVFRKDVSGSNDMELFDVDLSFENRVAEGSLGLPGDARRAWAVAAAAHSGAYEHRSFSSAGPANGPGGSLDGGHDKVDIAGYDGVSTVTLGTFYGTSAASPHVAGAAAIVRQAFPEFSEAATRQFLAAHAIDKGTPGPDIDYGWGRLSLGVAPGSSCEYDVSPESAAVGPEVSGGLIFVTTTDICFWQAISNQSWISLQTDANTGTGVIVYRVEENPTFAEREGHVEVAGYDFVVTQSGQDCALELSPASLDAPTEGVDSSFSVVADSGCPWTAQSEQNWITIVGDAQGVGSGEVAFRVAPNVDEEERDGRIAVRDEVFEVHQDGSDPSVPWRAVVGGVADSPGAQGTRWATDLAVANRSNDDLEAQLTYRYGGNEVIRSATIAAGAIVEWQRVPVELFGVSEVSSGSVEVSAGGPLVVTARTYNNASDGTFGQFLPGITASDTLASGEEAVLAPLVSNDAFRTNLGFVNPGSSDRVGGVQIHGPDGEPRGTQVSTTVPAGGWYQLDRIFNHAGAGECDGCYGVVTVADGTGSLWAYASVVDNTSGDPTTIPMVPTGEAKADRRWLVAGLADVDGLNQTRWSSTFSVVHHGSGQAEGNLTYRSGSHQVDSPITFDGSGMQLWNNVVADLFERPETAGAVEVTSANALVTTARTFNAAPDGTFGQYLPAVEAEKAIRQSETAVLSQLKSTEGFRTNIGFVNFGSGTCTATITLYDADGSVKGQPIFAEIPAAAWVQKNRVFASAGAVECPLGYAVVEVSTTDCPVWAYASVVDNQTGDPTTVPMVIED